MVVLVNVGARLDCKKKARRGLSGQKGERKKRKKKTERGKKKGQHAHTPRCARSLLHSSFLSFVWWGTFTKSFPFCLHSCNSVCIPLVCAAPHAHALHTLPLDTIVSDSDNPSLCTASPTGHGSHPPHLAMYLFVFKYPLLDSTKTRYPCLSSHTDSKGSS